MRTQTRSPTRCASRSRPCANGSANPGSSPPCPASATASTQDPILEAGEGIVDRQPGLSVRLKLTLSYAGFLMLTGFLMLVAAWLVGRGPGQSVDLMPYIPDDVIRILGALVPGNRAFLLRAYAPAAAIALAFLLVFGLVGG